MIYIYLLLLLTACAPHYLSDAAFELREGHFAKAEQQLAKADVPFQKSKDAPLLLLSRAMVYFQAGPQAQRAAHTLKRSGTHTTAAP